MTTDAIKVVESPRDAWQGLTKIIPTEAKVAYLRKLIDLGFRHLDAVSFVAPKYVPQMADSEGVAAGLIRHANGGIESPLQRTEIIGIVVNERGLDRALATPGVTTIGYPYSISAQFRRQNANMSLSESRALLVKMLRRLKLIESEAPNPTDKRGLVVYISMAFGNPFDEPWSPEIVEETLVWLKEVGVKIVSLADTVGTAGPEEVGELFRAVKHPANGIELGAHLHSRPEGAVEKVLAAYEAGCRRFDCALTGLGGCPFAGDELVGNIPSEIVVSTLAERGVGTGIEPGPLSRAVEATQEIRRLYAR